MNEGRQSPFSEDLDRRSRENVEQQNRLRDSIYKSRSSSKSCRCSLHEEAYVRAMNSFRSKNKLLSSFHSHAQQSQRLLVNMSDLNKNTKQEDPSNMTHNSSMGRAATSHQTSWKPVTEKRRLFAEQSSLTVMQNTDYGAPTDSTRPTKDTPERPVRVRRAPVSSIQQDRRKQRDDYVKLLASKTDQKVAKPHQESRHGKFDMYTHILVDTIIRKGL